VVRHSSTDASYGLTEAGRDLFPLIQALGEWGRFGTSRIPIGLHYLES